MALNILFWFLAVEQKYYDLPLVLYEGHHTVPALFIPDTFFFSRTKFPIFTLFHLITSSIPSFTLPPSPFFSRNRATQRIYLVAKRPN